MLLSFCEGVNAASIREVDAGGDQGTSRLLDTANEEIYALLQNAKYVLLNIPGGC